MLQNRVKRLCVAVQMALVAFSGLSSVVYAHATSSERSEVRSLPLKKQEAIYKKIAAKAKQNQKVLSLSAKNKDIVTTLQTRDLCASKTMIAFPKTPHFLHERSPQGELVTIENGSAWAIKEADQPIARGWSQGTALTISPNELSLWGKLTRKELRHKYRIINLVTNESVQANLSLGPFIHNPHTLQIRRIDKYAGEIAFTNGTLWRVDTSHLSAQILHDWLVDDFIITGQNNTWFGLGYADIIINVSTDNWLPAQRVY